MNIEKIVIVSVCPVFDFRKIEREKAIYTSALASRSCQHRNIRCYIQVMPNALRFNILAE